jgi:hypothetical protein
MGFLRRLQGTLGLAGPEDSGTTPKAPELVDSWTTGDADPTETLPLFVHRMNRLSQDQWGAIQETWRAAAADPVRSTARIDAERRGDETAREHHHTVEMHSEVHVEFAGPGGRLLGAASPAVRKRVETMEADLRERGDIRRDALLALANRADLSEQDFAALYEPFEPFIPRADLERDATDWTGSSASGRVEASEAAADPAARGPEVKSSLEPPRSPPADSGTAPDPWRDVRWSDEEPPTRG